MKPSTLLGMFVAWVSLSCVGTTGGDLFEVEAYAAGTSDEGAVTHFSNSQGYEVQLDEARLVVGGFYLNRSRPASVSSDTSCTLAGIYVAQVFGGREIDLLSSEPQLLGGAGLSTSERALTGEVWLARGDVNEVSSSTAVLRVRGRAEGHGRAFPFEGTLSIGRNRVVPASDPALPGQHPLCKQRIVSPIPVDLVGRAGQSLLLRVDVRGMFANVDFATLSERDGSYVFSDETGADQASDNLYSGLRRATGVYTFSWMEVR